MKNFAGNPAKTLMDIFSKYFKGKNFQDSIHYVASRDINNVNGTQNNYNSVNVILTNEQVETLAKISGITNPISYMVDNPNLDVPPPIEAICLREGLVTRITEEFKSKTWCAVHGDLGSGKTQLAILVAQSLGICKAWIGLRGSDLMRATFLLDQSLSSISNTDRSNNLNELYNSVCSNIPPNSLLVIDDLPRLNGHDALDERLITLARACSVNNIKLLTTSFRELSSRYIQTLGPKVLSPIEIPRFTNEEIKELFSLYSAPETISEQFISQCASVTKRHPALLNALARYLLSKKWSLSFQEFIELSKGEYTQGLSLEVYEMLKLEEPETRDLLYRLSFIDWPYSDSYVWSVSAIKPEITRPVEKITNVMGLWIQRNSEDKYLTSPLLFKFGKENIGPNTKSSLHIAIANTILKDKILGPLEAWRAFSNFWTGEAYSQAGFILFTVLMSLNTNPTNVDDWGFTLILSDVNLPKQMDLKIRLAIRALQISLFIKRRKSGLGFLIDNIKLLLKEVDKIDQEIRAVCFVVAMTLAIKKPMESLGFLGIAFRDLNYSDFDRLFKEKKGPDIESTWWIIAHGLKTPNDLKMWIVELEKLSSEQLERVAKSDLAADGIIVVANSIWLNEHRKEAKLQRWKPILSCLEELSLSALKLNWLLLWACFVRARSIVLAEYLKDVDGSVNLARQALKSANQDPRVQFMLKEVIGRELAFNGEISEAAPWLEEALSYQFDGYAKERLDTCLLASRNLGDMYPERGLYFADMAVKLAQEIREHLSPLYFIKVLGELAIASWLCSGIESAFSPLNEAVNLLLKSKSDTEEWKSFFVRFGHIMGYFSSLAMTGKPPDSTSEGETYFQPKRGMLFWQASDADVVKLYNDQDWIIALHMGLMAEGVRKGKYAQEWMLRAYEMSQGLSDLGYYRSFWIQLIPYLIQANRYKDALKASIDSFVWMEAWGTLDANQKFESRYKIKFDANEIIGRKPSTHWDSIENKVINLTLFPSVLNICLIWLQDNKIAINYAVQVIDACNEIAIEASNPFLWKKVSEMLQKIFVEKGSDKEVIALIQETDDSSVKVLGHLGMMLMGTPQQAALFQNAMMNYLHQLQPLRGIYYKIIVPCFLEYWKIVFQKKRFLFSIPNFIEREIEAVISDPKKDDAIKTMLNLIAIGLNVKLQ